MAKTIKEELRNHKDEELSEIGDIIDKLSHRHRYDQVFEWLVNELLFMHMFPGNGELPYNVTPKLETGREAELFSLLSHKTMEYYKARTGLYTGCHGASEWVDPLGTIYETITGAYKSSALGQFFTPPSIVSLMTQLVGGDKATDEILFFEDPSCGSGRTLLSKSSYLYSIGQAHYACATDLDPICAKMTAVNFIMHGVMGEVVCMDSLVGPSKFRWGLTVFPMQYIIEEVMGELQRLVFYAKMAKGGNWYDKKMHCWQPVIAEQLYTVMSFKSMEARAKAEREKAEKDRLAKEEALAIQELTEKAKGTLFESNIEALAAIELKKQKSIKKSSRLKADTVSQPSLF